MRLQKRKIAIVLLTLSILLTVLAILTICKKNEITVAYAEEALENEEETEESEEDTSAQELIIDIENDLNAQGKI